MMALRFAIRLTPTARVMLITAGRPSGIEETAEANAKRKISSRGNCVSRPKITVNVATPTAKIPNFWLRSSVRFCSGDSIFSVSWINVAILPISVCEPVA